MYIRTKLEHQIQLRLDRIHIIGTTDVGARIVVGVDQSSFGKIGNRGSNDWNGRGLTGYRLRSRRCNGQYQIHLVTNKFIRNGGKIVGLSLSVLICNLDIFSVLISLLFQGGNKTFPGRIESRMIHQLNDTNLCLAIVCTTGSHRQRHYQRNCGSGNATKCFHKFSSFLWTTGSPVLL